MKILCKIEIVFDIVRKHLSNLELYFKLLIFMNSNSI